MRDLTPVEEADADELHRLIEANRAHLAPWLPWAAEQRYEHTVEFIRRGRRQQAANDGFQAVLLSDGAIVGMVGFHAVNWAHRSTTIGYWLGESHQGGGLMMRAVRALVDHAFGEWGLHRVQIQAAVGNASKPRDPRAARLPR
jgi:ribosomal-protein-serine acetyltransferase